MFAPAHVSEPAEVLRIATCHLGYLWPRRRRLACAVLPSALALLADSQAANLPAAVARVARAVAR